MVRDEIDIIENNYYIVRNSLQQIRVARPDLASVINFIDDAVVEKLCYEKFNMEENENI